MVLLFKVFQCVCSPSLADGRLLSWGWNEHGMCGTGDQQDVMSPLPVQLMQDNSHSPLLIGTGAGTSFALVQKPNVKKNKPNV